MTLVELDDEVPMQLGDFADGMSWLLTGDVCFFHHYLELYRYILIVHHILYIIYIVCFSGLEKMSIFWWCSACKHLSNDLVDHHHLMQ